MFLISDDRALFCKGLLAIIKAQKTVILPHTNAPGLLEDLLQEGDIILSDQENLKTIPEHFIDLKNTAKKGNSSCTPIDRNAEIIFYTSGSTGEPKAIHKKLLQLENEVVELQKTWALKATPNSTVFSMVPHHYLYGFLFSLLWPLCAKSRNSPGKKRF